MEMERLSRRFYKQRTRTQELARANKYDLSSNRPFPLRFITFLDKFLSIDFQRDFYGNALCDDATRFFFFSNFLKNVFSKKT